MEHALEVPLRPSRFGLGLLFFHALPLACLAGEGVPLWVRWAVPLVVLGFTGLSLLKIRADWSRYLVLHASGAAFVRGYSNDPDEVPVSILATSSDLGWVLVLRWQDTESGKHGHACLIRDGFGEKEWRCLRAWLRWRIKNSSV